MLETCSMYGRLSRNSHRRLLAELANAHTRTNVPEKLLKIVDEIAERGEANLTRLTILKKWFEEGGRLTAFALWVAARASSRKDKTKGEAAELFREAQMLVRGLDQRRLQLDKQGACCLYERLQAFQQETRRGHWGDVCIIHNWQLLLVEKSLAIALGKDATPAASYKLAADYCQNYDPRFGNSLNGPSQTKIQEIVRFMFTKEALEDLEP